MNSLYFLVSVVLLFSASKGNEYDSKFGFMEYSDAKKCSETKDYVSYICADNSTVQVCINRAESSIRPCPASAPNCDTGRCTSPPVPFKCPILDGFYPDPTDCQKYHMCVNGKDTPENCNPNYIYSLQTRSCVRKAGKPCYTIDCHKTSNPVVVYPEDKSIFAVCDLVTNSVLAMGGCGEHFEMNVKEGDCKLVCSKGEGNYPDPSSYSNFHECFLENNGVYNSTKKQCPDKSFFHPTKKYCVAERQSEPTQEQQ